MAKNNRAGLVDVYVGSRIRLRRTVLGLLQGGLADLLGITYQQIQKYESGVNRVGASRLFEMSCLLDVSVDYFFEAIPEYLSEMPLPGHNLPSEPVFGEHDSVSLRRDVLEWIDAFYQITDLSVRHRVFELIKSLPPGTAHSASNNKI